MLRDMLEASKDRLESPTSILTYIQCPRKYYYRYVKGLEAKPSIHLVMGGIVHSTIHAFHQTDITTLRQENFFEPLRSRMLNHLTRKWDEAKEEFESLKLSSEEIESFYGEARSMVDNFFNHHISRLVTYQHRHNLSLTEAFERLRPRTETRITSQRFGVMGVIDAIHDFDGQTVLIDYKTSKKNEVNEEYLLQLAIYALLYKEFFGRLPDKVGIHFLRHGEKLMPSSHELLALGEKKCMEIRNVTKGEEEKNYPQKKSGLCKYRTGQCDYYEICI